MKKKDLLYSPGHFRIEDQERLHAFIDLHGFGVLLSNSSDGELKSSWLPLMLSSDRLSLEGHLARANPQWQDWESSPSTSVLFLGPHAYISPTAYSTQKSVPTWNYATVRVDGEISIVEESASAVEIVSKLVAKHEQNRDPKWEFNSDSEFSKGLLKAIVCFRLQIKSIYGSFKMSQNKSDLDRGRVIEYLRQTGSLTDQDCAAFMEGLDES
ncbi:FMN-binding negative transcriptional regulator [bacterium]|jgi:transcriptional regulator|nr:FMN-binding negative transcriptional regulator [Verrucomicrobiota bacterium]MDA7497286.1 FMN-binding negative transcriptional regulator [bacterium]